MILSELLQLNKTNASINKIDLFINEQIKNSYEHLKALSYKAIILHSLGKTNEALRILYQYIPFFNEIETDGIIAICDGIIDICLDVGRFDEAKKYIKTKQSYLPISKSVLNLKDNIKLYLALNDIDNAKDVLEKYLHEDITKEEAIFAKVELSKIYFRLGLYDKYMNIIIDPEKYYQDNFKTSELQEIGYNRIYIAFVSANYLKVISDANKYLADEALLDIYKIKSSTLLMKAYLKNNDFKKASIVESDYCEYLSKDLLEESLAFSYVAKELYEKTHTVYSINEYQNKINEFEEYKKELKNINKKQKKKSKEEIVIPVLSKDTEEIISDNIFTRNLFEEKKEAEIFNQKINYEPKEIKNIVLSENYFKLEKVFSAICEIDLSLKFREIFRLTAIEIEREFNISEMYILYFDKNYKGMHYKKERVYDKKLSYDDITNTINYAAINFSSEAFLDNEDTKYNKNILTNELYEDIPYAIAMPLFDNVKVMGSIAFFSNDDFLKKEMTYESLRLITKVLNTRFLISIEERRVEANNKKLFFLRDNLNSGMKEQIDDYLTFSPQACKILGVYPDMMIDDYFNKMKASDVGKYKNILDELYALNSNDLRLEYDFKRDDKYIRISEKFFSFVDEGIVNIISIIDDITDENTDKNNLINLAYQNPISKMDTEVKLLVDLGDIYKYKVLSLAVIDIIDFDLYRSLYGYNFSNQLIYTVGKNLIKAFENNFSIKVYHLEIDRYVVLFESINDKRVIDSMLNKAFEFVTKSLYELNSRVDLRFNAGVYRLPKNNSINKESEILYYALDALDDAKGINGKANHICHFDGVLHKKKFNENALVTHVSEAIDHGMLSITYKQIVDLDNNKLFAYTIGLNLDNYDIDYEFIDYVIKRRGLIVNLEKYAISNTLKELKNLYDSVKGYLLCIVDVSKETLEDNFLSFINTQFKFYKVPTEYLVFKVSDLGYAKKLKSLGFKVAGSIMSDLINDNLDYFYINYKEFSLDAIKEVIDICNKHNTLYVIDNIDTKEDMAIAKLNKFGVIFGNYYNKALRMKNIIEKMK